MASRYRTLPCVVLLFSTFASAAYGCGACFQLPYQSLLERVERADRVVVAMAKDATGSSWQVQRVIKGDQPNGDTVEASELSQRSPANFQGPHILIWNQAFDSWTVETSADRELVAFLSRGIVLSGNGRELKSLRVQAGQLRFFLPYFEHQSTQIADSTHAKLSGAPYAVLQQLKSDLDPNQLRTWIAAQSAGINKRVALSIVLLGICGDQSEASLIKKWINENSGEGDPAYLTALLTAHLELDGKEALRFIEASYIQNRDRTLGEVLAAVDALRTHGQAGTTITRERIKASFQLLLRERPALVETMIDDFARWEDWSIAPRLMEIYASGKQPWNNALILKYFEACPLPAAKRILKIESASDKSKNRTITQQPTL